MIRLSFLVRRKPRRVFCLTPKNIRSADFLPNEPNATKQIEQRLFPYLFQGHQRAQFSILPGPRDSWAKTRALICPFSLGDRDSHAKKIVIDWALAPERNRENESVTTRWPIRGLYYTSIDSKFDPRELRRRARVLRIENSFRLGQSCPRAAQ